ncbi:hypothetical protein FSP39_005507 [Pinctada imbricata]|uniref:MULE transposase domain-containing protein n=1 Tax=Pinctada imbricata TaxID=66713 RepID=A0AA88YAT0_PINIB|nr:hypothetical protein FSP39_005507 [Pinctada imbricata]
MSSLLKQKKPLEVYNELTNKNDILSGPRNKDQIRNKKKNDKKKCNQTTGHIKNIADNIAQLEQLTLTDGSIVRSVIREQGKTPCIILYTDEQITDLKNICASGKTIVGIDKTFNLCDVHVTVLSYKQVSVIDPKTGDHPIFLGPMYLHDNSDFKTYATFFNHISTLLADVDTTHMVIGSDEEKSMVNAITHAFPTATHMLCTRHIRQNAKQKLVDDAVGKKDRDMLLNKIFGENGLTSANDTVCFDEISDEIEQETEKLSTKFHSYYTKKMKANIKSKVCDPKNSQNLDKNWTNNNSESLNHVLKVLIDWKTKPLLDFVQKNFLPSIDDFLLIQKRMELVTKEILVKYLTAFQSCSVEKIKHDYLQESNRKSEIVNLGVIPENPSTCKGTIQIMKYLNQYIPMYKDGQPFQLLCHGDQLSVERMLDAKLAMACSSSPSDQLAGLVPRPQNFHRRCILMQDSMNLLYSPSSLSEKGTLMQIRNQFHFNNVSKKVMDNVNHVVDFWNFITEALICLLACKYLEISSIDDVPDIPEKSKRLDELSSAIVDEVWPKIFMSSIADICYTDINGFLPERLAKELVWNSTANLSGLPGHNVALDLVNEFLNNDFKTNLKDSKGHYTETNVKRCSRLVGGIGNDLDMVFEDIVDKKIHQSKKKDVDNHKAIVKFLSLYSAEDLFTFQYDGRSFKGYENFHHRIQIKNKHKLKERLQKYSSQLDKEQSILN